MRGWISSVDRTTKRVFIVIAIAWFAFVGGPLMWAYPIVCRHPCLSGPRSPIEADIAWATAQRIGYLGLPMILPYVVVSSAWHSAPTNILLSAAMVINSLFWATMITRTYARIRSLRERHAASKAV